MKTIKTIYSAALAALVLPAASWAQDDAPEELEAFIAQEVALEDSDSLLPTDRTVDSAFFDNMELTDIPRAITVLSPEAMKQFQINDFDDLQKIGAGTERYNFYGIAGAPIVRGWQGGIYFNGMLRPFQRNEMPTSFGSLEAMEIVKGPAPAQFVPSHVGGYVNMIPKSPFYDSKRGQTKLEVGSNNLYNFQYDLGGPTLIAGKPAAYRLSLTAQQAGSYYDDIGNDYVSIYGAIKMKSSEDTSIFAGFEYYEFKSNENAGWNRPTQNLVDNNQYVIGEPLSLVRTGNGGFADRNLTDAVLWGSGLFEERNPGDFRALVVDASIIDAAVSAGTVTAAQLAAMKDMSDATVRAATYEGLPDDVAQTTSGYLYTPEYFDLGGQVFTTEIDASDVLSDPGDFADSEDLMVFFDIDHEFSSEMKLKNQLFIESINTDKWSSYQYAIKTKQLVIDDRISLTNDIVVGDAANLTLSYGAQIRYTDSMQLQDFWSEPMGRRDVTREVISANTTFLSGDDIDPISGNNHWGGLFGAGGPGGHAVESELLQAGVFASGLLDFGDSFTMIGSLRLDSFDYEASVPSGPTDIDPNTVDGDDTFVNWSINPSVKLGENLTAYGAWQESTTYVPTQGGAVIGDANFGDSELKEIGLKASALEGKLFSTLAYYEWEQASFNDLTGTADPYESEGFEFELTYAPTEKLTFIASYGERETRRTTPLGFRTMPFGLLDPTGNMNDEIGVALGAGTLFNQFADAIGGFTPEGGNPSNNPEFILPGAPESVIKLFAAADLTDAFGVSASIIHKDGYWHSFDQVLEIDSSTVLSMNLWYRIEAFELLLSIDNLTEEDYFIGADPNFAANNLITKAPEEMQAKLTLTIPF